MYVRAEGDAQSQHRRETSTRHYQEKKVGFHQVQSVVHFYRKNDKEADIKETRFRSKEVLVYQAGPPDKPMGIGRELRGGKIGLGYN